MKFEISFLDIVGTAFLAPSEDPLEQRQQSIVGKAFLKIHFVFLLLHPHFVQHFIVFGDPDALTALARRLEAVERAVMDRDRQQRAWQRDLGRHRHAVAGWMQGSIGSLRRRRSPRWSPV